MARKKKLIDQNATPPANSDDNLKGGTQHGDASRQMVPGSPSGGTNPYGSPRGGTRPDKGPADPPGGREPDQRGSYTDARLDAADAFEGGSRHLSEATAKQHARDAVDGKVDTAPRSPHVAEKPRDHEIEPTE
jgi:hypothetical protein